MPFIYRKNTIIFLLSATVLSSILSCSKAKKNTFDKNSERSAMGVPEKNKLFLADSAAFQILDTPTFVITDSMELQIALSELKNADDPGPWKGAG
ncbi:MAG: hypothetical protein H7282_08945 [Cytophagaceae bacterium]|nr:hypothetical protein [Cytophagaceae bacterium]